MIWLKIWRRRTRKLRRNSFGGKFSKSKLFSKLFFFSFIGLLVLILGFGAIFAFYAKDLPQPDKIVRREGFSTKIYDRNEKLLYDVYADQKRTPIDLEEAPDYLRQATIAVEDKNFYQHSGFDFMGIFRAVFNIVVKQKLQGGSTLTQQLVKNVLLTPQRTITRKLKEFILTVQIESRYSKDEILQMYLNEAPYGGTAWGVGAAAETYFDKEVEELNLVESAILAGLPQRPSVYSPFSGENVYIGRTKEVLRRMREDGYITDEQEKAAVEELEQVEFAGGGGNFKAPHFVMYVKKQLEEQYGQAMVEKGGLRVYTSLDLELQDKAQKIIEEKIAVVESLDITNGAAVVVDPETGQILAMVGSKNYFADDYDGKVNVTLSLRQPGSAIKPVTYATAFKKGYTASSLIMDVETIFPGSGDQPDYVPVNYDGNYNGPMQLRFALGNSINLPAVKLLALVGIENMLVTASDLGISTLAPTKENMRRLGLSVTLGGGEVRLLELTSAYSAFANEGFRVDPIAILKVEDREGKILFEQKGPKKKKVFSEGVAFLVSHILSDNNARLLTFGSRNALTVSGRTVAVKTGTTNDKRDNWTVGWTPQIVVGVWVGNNDNSPMKQVTSGISGAAPIWREIIQESLKGKPNLGFTAPESVVTAEVDAISGYRTHDGYPSRMEYFIKGTEPNGEDPVHAKLKICRGEDKLATSVQVARGEYEEKEYFVFEEKDPFSIDDINRWQQGIDEWIKTQGEPRYHAPRDYCEGSEGLEVVIDEPKNEIEVDNNEVKIKGKIISVNEVKKIEIIINDETKETLENTSWFEKIFTLSDGIYTIKVKAWDSENKEKEGQIKIGVNKPWDWSEPTAVPTPTDTPSPTNTPSPIPTTIPTP